MKEQLMMGTRSYFRILALAPAFLLLISCGATHYSYQQRAQTLFDGTGPTPTPTPRAVPTMNMPWVFQGPSLVANGLPFVPTYEMPCDAGGTGSDWAYLCVNKGTSATCQALQSDCVAAGEPLLNRTQAQGRSDWFRRCFGSFPDYMSAQGVADGMDSPGHHPCPEYVMLGRYDANGKVVRVPAPVDPTSPCDAVPVDVFPAKFCTTQY